MVLVILRTVGVTLFEMLNNIDYNKGDNGFNKLKYNRNAISEHFCINKYTTYCF